MGRWNMKQHKWHKEIKAWADGAEIQHIYPSAPNPTWLDSNPPNWIISDDIEYRIKPQPKEPQYLYVYYNPKQDKVEVEIIECGEGFESLKYIGKIKLEIEDER